LDNNIPRNIQTYAENTQTITGIEKARKINGYWGYGFLPNDLRVFLFKMHNNILGQNNRVAHFVANVEPTCTFCTLSGDEEAQEETTLHLFYTCPHIENISAPFFTWAFNKNELFHISRAELFTIQDETILGDNARTTVQTLICKIF